MVLSENRLASGSNDESIKIWDLSTFTCLQTLTGHRDTVMLLVALSENCLASSSADRSIKIWSLGDNIAEAGR